MRTMSSATALRQIDQARAGLRKARRLLSDAREKARDGGLRDSRRDQVLRLGWISLAASHKLLSEIPVEAVDAEVMTQQLAVERYAAALLVRLRRLLRNQLTSEDGELEDADMTDEA